MAVRVVGGSWGARGAGGLLCRLSVCTVKGYSRGTAVCFGGRGARAPPASTTPYPGPAHGDFFLSGFFCVSSLYIEKNHSTLQRGMLHTHRSRAFRGRGERAPCLAGRV